MANITDKISIFDYQDIRKFTENKLISSGGRGNKTKLATAIGCQPAYITRVFNGDAQFSLEHISKMNQFFGHSKDEGEYFLFLGQWERAGTRGLKDFFWEKLKDIQTRRTLIKERMLERKEISLEDQVTYYSSWYYTAIHILVSIPHLQTRPTLAKHLSITLEELTYYLEFLITRGFINEENGKLINGKTKLHLSRDSPMISKLHTNWRIQAIDSLNKYRTTDIHFSGVYTLSKKDKEKLQVLFVDFIDRADKLIRPSPEEIGCVLTLDLFELE
jgi:uncharacterized protein (TIGR02147 family)